MTELELKIKTIQAKLQQLLKEYSVLQKENQRLEKELSKSKEQYVQQQLQIDTLKQQMEVAKISSGNWNEKDKKEFEKRISSYVKEIDRCIVLLSE
jgi:predicted  nucleic acid-binding Zn-ribbon protein